MEVRVLIVDDSVFYRHRLVGALSAEKDIVIVGEACNGMEAVEKAKSLHPDVIIMDVTMPVMDGVTAVRRIMKESPTQILMFSSLTTKGAQATFDALDAGAIDFMTKHLDVLSGDPRESLRHLCRRVRVLGTSAHVKARIAGQGEPHGPTEGPQQVAEIARRTRGIQLIVIGTSTGGPVALQTVLTLLPRGYRIPVLVVQHMPSSFTTAFAERLNNMCLCEVKEVKDGDRLESATIYIAPGGYQTAVTWCSDVICLQLREPSLGDIYRPSVDIAFASAAEVFSGNVLGVVLTGMGTDGMEGARRLRSCGSKVWVQDEQSSTIFGMPKAVLDAGYADRVMSLQDMAKALSSLV